MLASPDPRAYFLAIPSLQEPQETRGTGLLVGSTADVDEHRPDSALSDSESDTAARASDQLPDGSRAYPCVPHVVVTGGLADLLDAEHLRAALLSALAPAVVPCTGPLHIRLYEHYTRQRSVARRTLSALCKPLDPAMTNTCLASSC